MDQDVPANPTVGQLVARLGLEAVRTPFSSPFHPEMESTNYKKLLQDCDTHHSNSGSNGIAKHDNFPTCSKDHTQSTAVTRFSNWS